MAWAPTLPLDTSKIRLSAGYIRNNNTALQTGLSASTLNAAVAYIPNTHAVFFYADTAPTGWTIVGSTTDCLLALKGGSSAYNVTGGQVVGTWNGPGYALVAADVPRLVSSGGVGPLSFEAVSFQTFAASAHSHDWTSTRPYAAVGILCTKDA